MIDSSSRRLALSLAGGVMGLAVTMSAFAHAPPTEAIDSERATPLTEAQIEFWHALMLEPPALESVWARLRESFHWQDKRHHARVQKWIDKYRMRPENIVAITERARPWLYWITEQLEERDLPGEIALLPFIESSFDPSARSARGAMGLWQFMPGTGDALGLARNGNYDGRLDVVASTNAALDYIEQQADEWYEGDLELSLAAYNAGAGTVNAARRAAAANGSPDDYWHLQLPTETMNYLPKLLAIATIIDEAEEYAITLPDIEDAPGFAKIEVYQPIDLAEAADLADLDREELEALNPGLLNGSALPEHGTVLLVPADSEEKILAELDKLTPDVSPGGWQPYVVSSGDSLSVIASRHGVSVEDLRRFNGLDDDTIRVGQTLQVPQRTLAAN